MLLRMNPWYAKGAVLAASVLLTVIRAPHGQRSRGVKVATSRKGALEKVLLTMAWIGFLVPIAWVATDVFSFAEYRLWPVPYSLGCVLVAAGLWLFHRSHADLGTNWSITLEIRESHQLVTQGVYRRIRHPMYTSLLLYSLGFLFLVPNWIVGPSYFVPMALLLYLRMGPEERMMRERFGVQYEEYMARSKRLVPGIW